MAVQEEIERASRLGQQLEDLVVQGYVTPRHTSYRDKLLLAYWSLAFDLHKSILALMRNRYYGGAFALLDPLVEAEVRARVISFNFRGFFDRFLYGRRSALGSSPRSGLSQLGRRFNGDSLELRYGDGEIIEVIRRSTTAVFTLTNLVAKRFQLIDEGRQAEALFIEWGGVRSRISDGSN